MLPSDTDDQTHTCESLVINKLLGVEESTLKSTYVKHTHTLATPQWSEERDAILIENQLEKRKKEIN